MIFRRRSAKLADIFRSNNLKVATQKYAYHVSNRTIAGENVYAILQGPRADATEAIVLIGFTCAGIQVAALPGIVSTYAVDSYKPVAGSLFVAITVNKNVWGYGFGKFITPWSMEAG